MKLSLTPGGFKLYTETETVHVSHYSIASRYVASKLGILVKAIASKHLVILIGNTSLLEEHKQRIIQEATIYKPTSKHKLKEFEVRVNAAAAELCLNNVSLLNRCGELLQEARKKVADDGYAFKKGRSQSKSYGHPETESTPKRPKYNQELREERLRAIHEELDDISRMLLFKERHLSQS